MDACHSVGESASRAPIDLRIWLVGAVDLGKMSRLAVYLIMAVCYLAYLQYLPYLLY